MGNQSSQTHPALKHGGYSGVTLLPGEDSAAFEKLHKDLITEYAPHGRHEEDIVASIAHLVWRKQNLSTYRLAEKAKNRYSAIYSSLVPSVDFRLSSFDNRAPEEVRAAQRAAEEQARKELGKAWELAKMGEDATTDHLLIELSIVDRIEGIIDRCLKRLLFVRGLKSISSASSASTSSAAPPARIRGPSKAA
jgi:hypothetical protein